MYVCVCILIYEICIGYKTAHISYWHDIIMMIGVYCSFVNLKYVFKTQNVFFFFFLEIQTVCKFGSKGSQTVDGQ